MKRLTQLLFIILTTFSIGTRGQTTEEIRNYHKTKIERQVNAQMGLKVKKPATTDLGPKPKPKPRRQEIILPVEIMNKLPDSVISNLFFDKFYTLNLTKPIIQKFKSIPRSMLNTVTLDLTTEESERFGINSSKLSLFKLTEIPLDTLENFDVEKSVVAPINVTRLVAPEKITAEKIKLTSDARNQLLDVLSVNDVKKFFPWLLNESSKKEINKKTKEEKKLSPEEKLEKELRTRILELEDAVNKASLKSISIGFSVGPRFDTKDSFEYTIAGDSTLTRDALSKNAFIVSSSLNILPFTKSQTVQNRIDLYDDGKYRDWWQRTFWKGVQNLGFFVNINIANINTSQGELSFNKSIDGGIGIGLRLAPRVYLAYSWEWFEVRQLRDVYVQNIDDKLIFNGQTITTLETSDNRFFRSTTARGNSLRLILGF